MTRFETQPLEQVATLFSGGTPRKSDDALWRGDVPWLTPKDMGNWTGTTEQTVSATAIGNGTKLAPENACYVAVRGMSLHNEIRVVRSNRSLTFNQDIKAIAARGGVDPRFLYYSLVAQKPQLLEWVTSAGHGTGVLETDRLKSLPIPIIPRSEQSRIVETFASIDDKIELNWRMNETLEAMAQAIFRDWFVDFGPTRRKLEGATDPAEIMGGLMQDAERAQTLADLFPAKLGDDGLPEGWRETGLGAVAKDAGGIIQTGPFGSQLHQSDYVSSGLPVVMPANLTYSGFREGDFSYVSLDTTERLSKHRLKTGDIVYGRRGDIGRKALIGKHNEGWLCGTGCLKISFPAKSIPPEYLFYWLDHQSTLDWIRARAIGATMPNLNTSTLAEMPLMYPCDALLAAFEEMVKPMLALREENGQQNKTLAATRDLLLPKLISGEIRLPAAEELMEAAQ